MEPTDLDAFVNVALYFGNVAVRSSIQVTDVLK